MAGAEWAALRGASPTEMAHLSQPKLSAILRAEALRRAPAAGASLLSGYELVGLEQDATGVRAELRRSRRRRRRRRRRGGGRRRRAARPRGGRAGGAHRDDGARARLRRRALVGAPRLGPRARRATDAPEGRCTSARRSSATRCGWRGATRCSTSSSTRRRSACSSRTTLARASGWRKLPYYPQLQDEGELHADACAEIIAQCIGASPTAVGRTTAAAVSGIEVDAVGVVVGHERARRHALLRGALPHPRRRGAPVHAAGAFGANTGLQDAHNLAWKIALVHRGAAPAALLRSSTASAAPSPSPPRGSLSTTTTAACVSRITRPPRRRPRRSTRRCARWRPCQTRAVAAHAGHRCFFSGRAPPNAKRCRGDGRHAPGPAGRQRMLGSLVDADADGAPTAAAGDLDGEHARAAAAARVIVDGRRTGSSSDDERSRLQRRQRAGVRSRRRRPADDADAADGAAPPPDPEVEDETYRAVDGGGRAPPPPLARKRVMMPPHRRSIARGRSWRAALRRRFVAADGASPWLAAARARCPTPRRTSSSSARPTAAAACRGGGRRGSLVRARREAAGGRRSGRWAGGALLVRPDGHVAWRCRAADGPPAEAEAAAQLDAALTRALRRA